MTFRLSSPAENGNHGALSEAAIFLCVKRSVSAITHVPDSNEPATPVIKRFDGASSVLANRMTTPIAPPSFMKSDRRAPPPPPRPVQREPLDSGGNTAVPDRTASLSPPVCVVQCVCRHHS